MSEQTIFGTDQPVIFTSAELTVLSDILRRVPDGNWFARQDEFTTALRKIERAKLDSYRTDEA